MAYKVDVAIPGFALNDGRDEDWAVHGVRCSDESAIGRPTDSHKRHSTFSTELTSIA
jgi:hypothetical protein